MEDNPTDIFVIEEVLRSCGFGLELRIVGDGREAIEYLREIDRDSSLACPDLLLVDLNVPRVDGLEVLRYLRVESRSKEARAVVVTSSTAAQDRAAARQWKADAYFQKPKDLDAYMELASVIRRVLALAE